MINNPVIPSFDIAGLISGLIAMAILVAALLTFLYLAWGGIEWIVAGGDKAGLESARNRITNALIGLTIVAASWAVMMLITTFLGFPFPCIPIPTLSGVNNSNCPVNQQGQAGTCSIGGQPCSSSNPCPAGQSCVSTQPAPGQPGAPGNPAAGTPGANCTVDTNCNSRVCSFTKCAYDCAHDITHTFGASECSTHNSCQWSGTACVYRPGFP